MKKMRVLWIVNLIPANFSNKIGLTSEVLGGWVESMLSELVSADDIQIGVVCKCHEKIMFSETFENIMYYSLGYSSKTKFNDLVIRCSDIIQDFKPDIIHIEGTEFLHARAMLESAENNNVPAVVSLQGILNGQYQYQCGNLQIDDMMFSKSFTNIFAAWILHLRKTRWFKPRLETERSTIQKAKYIIGRTTWDKAHSYAINPQAKYYHCSRNLRKPFYEKKWDIRNIEKHSIYVGNGYYALKGLHFVVEAVAQLKYEYPDIKVYVAGYKPFKEGDSRSFIKKGYAAYLKKLIDDLDVSENFVFTGPLNAEVVADKLSKVNAYVLCSSIENSPNTLGEAMLVGTPCVSAYVGGVSDMAADGKDVLYYRNDDAKLLAWNIKRLFDNEELCLNLSENAKKRALITHNTVKNAEIIHNIYKDIFNDEK